jgi:hypothetical protein
MCRSLRTGMANGALLYLRLFFKRRVSPGAARPRRDGFILTPDSFYCTFLRRRWIKKISTITNNTPQTIRISVTLSISTPFL